MAAPARTLLRTLYAAGLAGVDPDAAVARALSNRDVRGALTGRGRIGIFACGKAAAAMARGALRTVPGSRGADALVILPRRQPAGRLSGARVLRASHPQPDASSVRAAREALRFFASYGRGDAILCLISGGTSSLLSLPRAGVSLAAKRRAVDGLARSGASIGRLNRLRTSLSAVKGGRLGKSTAARLVTLVLSDVPGDRAALVGSGPTVRGSGRRDVVRVVGSNRDGLAAAAKAARALGLRAAISPRRLSGEAHVAGRRIARRAKALAPGSVWLAGGETVVTFQSAAGRGGRCLELALAAALTLDGIPGTGVHCLAAGSDGIDGSSSAAGAFVDQTTVSRARSLRLDPRTALERHATHAFFARVRDLFRTGPTGTNVGDWVFLIRGLQ